MSLRGVGGGGEERVSVIDPACTREREFVCWSLTSLCHSNGHIERERERESGSMFSEVAYLQ